MSHSLEKVKGLKMEFMIHHDYNKASIKFQKRGVQRAALGVTYPAPQGQKLLCSGPSQISPCETLHLAVHLYPLAYPLIQYKDFLESCEPL